VKNTGSSTLDLKIQFWSFLGPLFAIALLCLMPLNATPSSLYITVLIGLPICLIWKLRGLAISTIFIATIILYQVIVSTNDNTFWLLGLCTALALSFVITATSHTEVEALLSAKPTHIAPVNTNAHDLYNELQTTRNQLSTIEFQSENIKNDLNTAHLNLANKESLLTDFQNNDILAKMKHKELEDKILEQNQTIAQQETVLKSHSDQSDKIQNLEYQIEECNALLKDRLKVIEAVRNDSHNLYLKRETEVTTLRSALNKALEDIEKLNQEMHSNVTNKNTLKIHDSEFAEMTKKLAQKDQELAQKEQELSELHQKLQSINYKLELSELERNVLQNDLSTEKALSASQHAYVEQSKLEQKHNSIILQELNDRVETLSREKSLLEHTIERIQTSHLELNNEKDQLIALLKTEKETVTTELIAMTVERNQAMTNLTDIERAWRRSEGRYKQLQEQFNEKSRLVDDTRKQLFLSEENVLRLQHLQNELSHERSKNLTELEKHLSKIELEFDTSQNHYEQEINSLYELIDSLNSKL
jgi:hypothetical protein